ncbi:hypothetical protein SDC9_182136 [bioreactor metagenome]|uniref:Uncharacterized protein n=1 Tax=bioreactor metagenome TaxID=1076179 RepID=A0A645H8F0_9ZZZZ
MPVKPHFYPTASLKPLCHARDHQNAVCFGKAGGHTRSTRERRSQQVVLYISQHYSQIIIIACRRLDFARQSGFHLDVPFTLRYTQPLTQERLHKDLCGQCRRNRVTRYPNDRYPFAAILPGGFTL